MKQKILIRRINTNIDLPSVINNGEWIDLRAADTLRFKAPQSGTLKTRNIAGQNEKYRNVTFDIQLMPLGIAMQLPSGFEAIIAARSSLPRGFGVIMANSIGVIDNTYSGNTDEWKAPLLALRDTVIREGERICQFRIQLSQKATMWQKIKWFCTSGIKLVEVDELPNKEDRGGFGSTGK